MSRGPASYARTRNYARVQRERDERTHERRMGRPPRRIPFDLRHLSVRSHVITRNFVRLNVARTVLAVHFGSFWPGRLSKSPPLPRTANYPLTPPSCSDVTISAVHQEFVSRSSPPFFILISFLPVSRVFLDLWNTENGNECHGGERWTRFACSQIYIPRVIDARARSICMILPAASCTRRLCAIIVSAC